MEMAETKVIEREETFRGKRRYRLSVEENGRLKTIGFAKRRSGPRSRWVYVVGFGGAGKTSSAIKTKSKAISELKKAVGLQ